MNDPISTLSCCVYHWSFIYLIVNVNTFKKYVGQTIDYVRRMIRHKSEKGETYFSRSIEKHGWENFKCVIVCQWWMDKKQCNEMEIQIIAHFDTFKPNGYNLTKGGGGHLGTKWSDERRLKHSIMMSGENNPNFGKTGILSATFGKECKEDTRTKISKANTGKKRTVEQLASISGKNSKLYGIKRSKSFVDKHTGKNNAMYGKKRPDLAARNAANKGENSPCFGKEQSAEHIAKRAAAQSKRCRGKRKRGGEEWEEFENQGVMAKNFKCSTGTVSRIINGVNSPNFNFERIKKK